MADLIQTLRFQRNVLRRSLDSGAVECDFMSRRKLFVCGRRRDGVVPCSIPALSALASAATDTVVGGCDYPGERGLIFKTRELRLGREESISLRISSPLVR